MSIRWLLSLSLLVPVLSAQSPPRANGTSLPVRELAAFKDGHAYVLREAALPADAGGTVVLDELPAPVLGTFWPYASNGARLISAKAGTDKVTVQRPAATLLQIARANVGNVVSLELSNAEVVRGELLAIPAHGDQPGETLLMRNNVGTRAVPIARVIGIEISGEFHGSVAATETRQRLSLRVAGGGANAKVGLVYVQKGFRWIPSYRIDLDGAGKARVQIQAALVNDLVDLDDASVHLVVGVPKFAFADMIDPISLQQQTQQLARAARAPQAQFGNFLSNALTTQVAAYNSAAPQPVDPEAGPGESNEDLFVFPVKGVTLKKGERLVVPVVSFELPYRDLYRLDVPMAPPLQRRQNLQDQRVIELAKQLAAPKANHVLRLDNNSEVPLTTGPALVFRDGRVLAQGLMTYTPRGSSTDLEINTAIDIRVETEEHETGRTKNVRLGDHDYQRVDLTGSVRLINGKSVPVEIEVTRRMLGIVDEVGQGGSHQQLDLVRAWSDTVRPGWWSWWSWPYWWFHHNGFGKCRWTVELQPGERAELSAGWHYFWR